MVTLLRRLFWLALLGGAGYAAWSLVQRRQVPEPAAPEWPPLEPAVGGPRGPDANGSSADSPGPDAAPAASAASPPTGAAGVASEAGAAGAAPRWVTPVDGECPAGYPIKANDNSGIFHVPGGRFYERTIPERCYADAEAAEADGYRAAKA